MEDILDLYIKAWDSQYPIVCWDEKLYQLLEYTRQPRPTQVRKLKRGDYTYKRNDSCNFLLLFSPQAGWRQVKVTAQCKGGNYAEYLRNLVAFTG